MLAFKKDVDDKEAALERELLLNLETLYSVKGLFEHSDHVTPVEFQKMTQSIFIRHKDIQALEWIPKVLHSERETYVNKRKKEYPDFEITEREKQGNMVRASERDVYFPVYYVEPLAGNEVAFGYDLASNKKRQKTLELSRDQAKLFSTVSITLVQEETSQKGFLTFMPVYKGHPVTVDKRRENLRGFVLGVFRIADIFNSAIQTTTAQGMNLLLADVTDGFPETLHIDPFSKETDFILQSKFKYSKKLARFGNREWAIIATPTQGYIAERRGVLPYTIAIFGITFVIFGAVYTLGVMRRSAIIEETVLERTTDLNQAKKELEELALTDQLTNIANRRRFDESMAVEWKRSIREKTPISLMMIDIDHFKQFNDTYGHVAGDKCLIYVAQALQKSLHRSSDLVARYGGEEFVVVLPGTEDAFTPAEASRSNIENLRLPNEKSSVSKYVTISVGVATMVPENDSLLSEFIGKADRALYEAKETGRNKVYRL